MITVIYDTYVGRLFPLRTSSSRTLAWLLAACVFACAIPRIASAATSPVVFISDGARSAVLAFPAGMSNPKPIARITAGVTFPAGVATDAQGTLYVLNEPFHTASNVTVYPAGQTTPSRTLTLPLQESYIAAGPDGTVYVEGEVPRAGDGVFEFFPGADTPSLVINAPSQPPYAFGPVAADAGNNLYVAFAGGSCCGLGVFRYPPRSKHGNFYHGTGNAFGAMTFDGSGELLIALADQFPPQPSLPSILIVPPRGKPTTTPSLPANVLSFDAVDSLLYSANDTVSIIDFKTKRWIGSIGGIDIPTGIAVSPNPY